MGDFPTEPRSSAAARITGIVAQASADATILHDTGDSAGAHKLLLDAAVEHEKVYGPRRGYDPK